MSELKPCPFCGCDKIRFVERFNIKGGSYDCVECGSSAGRKLTQEFALVAWNTRAESPELAILNKQVRGLRESKKQMLDEIRVRLSNSTTGALAGYDKQQVDVILDEQEAKL